jgi:hypothetical protein
VTWLYEETGVDGKDLAVRVKLNSVTSLHVAVLVQVGYELIVEPAYCDERCGVVWYRVLCVDCALEHTTLLGDGVLRERDNGYPL